MYTHISHFHVLHIYVCACTCLFYILAVPFLDDELHVLSMQHLTKKNTNSRKKTSIAMLWF